MSDNFYARDLSIDLGEFEFRAADDGDGLTIAGYITRFGEPTLVQDWDGEYLEEMKRGSFSRTLAERGAQKVKMQFNHGHDSAFGALPVGVWTELREDRKGVWGEGRIHDTWHTIPIRAAIRSGALDGMSIKFRKISEQVRKGDPQKAEAEHRLVTEVALFEAGPVVHPAYEGTTVGLRARALQMYEQEYAPSSGAAATVVIEEAVAPVGDTDPVRAEAGPPVGITRQAMSTKVRALLALGVIHDSDRGAA